ncbi:MAG: ABC transporter ATP-binding protein [Xanthomonadaceae bacterium]|nr:ABC transporter ATP-binding protein [Xanthomonadaceae bacterium]
MIELQGIARRYPAGGQTLSALDGIDLVIGQGESVAITGPSGSGKSTLLSILGCLDRPSAGRYLLDGIDIACLDDRTLSGVRNRRIGFVFQSFHLLPRLTVLENVLLPLRFVREGLDFDGKARALELLHSVGLGQKLNQRPGELSGGQMQRVAIARALVLRPALLLADEPTGNLDSRSAADILALFEEVHAQGQTVVMVTHDTDLAERLPRQVRLIDGRVVDDRRQ